MAVDWQPAAPDTIGLGWFAANSGSRTIDSGYESIEWEFDATVTETVTGLRVPSGVPTQDGRWMVEVFEAGDEVTPVPTTTVFRPNGDFANEGERWWQGDWTNRGAWSINKDYAPKDVVSISDDYYVCILANGVSTTPHQPPNATYWTRVEDAGIYDQVDEATLNVADFITYIGKGINRRRVALNFATAGWAAARRVTAVRLVIVADTQQNTMVLRPYFDNGATKYEFGGQITVGTDRATFAASMGELNPTTGLPWTQADIATLDSTAAIGLRPFNGKSTEFRIYQWWIEIDWVPETRLVVGALDLTVSDIARWQDFASLVDPNNHATTSWAKVATTAYVVVLRQINGGTVAWPWLDSGEPLPTGWLQSYPPVDGDGCLRVDGAPYRTTRSYGLVFDIAGPAYSADGQPYNTGDDSIAASFAQLITAAVGGTYPLARFVTGIVAENPPPGPLTVTVHRESDDVQVGGSSVLTKEAWTEFPAVSSGLTFEGETYVTRLVECRFSPPPVLTAQQYYVKFEATSPAAGVFPWVVLQLEDTDGVGIPANFHRNLDTTLPGGLGWADIPVTLSTLPDAPTDFAVEVVTDPIANATPSPCLPQTTDHIGLAWTPTTLGDSFDHYEIQRDDGWGWQTIATITTEGVAHARDSDGRRHHDLAYRMRVIRSTDGIASDWTPTLVTYRTGTPDMPNSPAWLFTSNLRPDLTVAYHVAPDLAYEEPDADTQTITRMFGRDGAVRSLEPERRLDTFDLPLTVHLGSLTTPPLTTPGRRLFDPLLAIASQGHAPTEAKVLLPYVTVLSPTGDRWYAAVTVPKLSVQQPEDAHTTTVQVIELTQEPAPFDVALTGGELLAQAAWWIDAAEVIA